MFRSYDHLQAEITKGIHISLVSNKQVWTTKSRSIKREVFTYRECEKYVQNIGDNNWRKRPPKRVWPKGKIVNNAEINLQETSARMWVASIWLRLQSKGKFLSKWRRSAYIHGGKLLESVIAFWFRQSSPWHVSVILSPILIFSLRNSCLNTGGGPTGFMLQDTKYYEHKFRCPSQYHIEFRNISEQQKMLKQLKWVMSLITFNIKKLAENELYSTT
jgi:hypothetical protein